MNPFCARTKILAHSMHPVYGVCLPYQVPGAGGGYVLTGADPHLAIKVIRNSEKFEQEDKALRKGKAKHHLGSYSAEHDCVTLGMFALPQGGLPFPHSLFYLLHDYL